MTIRELSQLYRLNTEIEHNAQRLRQLEARLGPAAPDLSGMPHGKGGAANSTERLALELADLRAIILTQQVQLIHEQARLERYIATIPDSLTRQVFRQRFVDGRSWVQVAHRVGHGYTADAARMLCKRYVADHAGDEIG